MKSLRELLTIIVLAGALVWSACANRQTGGTLIEQMNRIAENYVKLALAVGQHDEAYVDAYYGPEEWKKRAEEEKKPLAIIESEASSLLRNLDSLLVPKTEPEILQLRYQYLLKQLSSMVARIQMLEGKKLSFDEESKALYDAAPPTFPEEHFQQIIDKLEEMLPGNGTIDKRYERYRSDFIIPKDKLDSVFKAAIEETRSRTKKRIALPDIESFELEYVTNKAWSGYNWYKGGYHSLIQINTDLPIYIDRAIDLAAHEGYPGHHVYNVLLEDKLVREKGWLEFSVYPLFSPQSLIAEGSANFGIEVAFPGAERTAFERDVLYPLAGLDPLKAERFSEASRLATELNYAGNEAARRYLNGEIDSAKAAEWLAKYSLMSDDRARQRIKFIDQYRSYVINYNLGQDLVRKYIEKRGGVAGDPAKRWQEFADLISSPRLPSGLQ